MGGDICALSGQALDPDPTEAMDRKYQEVADRLRVIGDQLDRELASRLVCDNLPPHRPRRRDQYYSDIGPDCGSAKGKTPSGRQQLSSPPSRELSVQDMEADTRGPVSTRVPCRERFPERTGRVPNQPGDVVSSSAGYNSRTKTSYNWLASRLNCTRCIDMNHNYYRRDVVVGGIWASMMGPATGTWPQGALVTRCWRAARYGFHLCWRIIAGVVRGARTIATMGLLFYLELDMNPIILVRNRPEVRAFGTAAQRLLITSAIPDGPGNPRLHEDGRPLSYGMKSLDRDHSEQDPPTTALR